MLEIVTQNTLEAFILPDNIEIPLEFYNPAFDDAGSLSYAFDLVDCPQNRRLVNFIYRPGTTKNNLIPVILRINGAGKKCTLQVLEKDRGIKCNLLFDEGGFMAQYGDTLLSDLDLGGQQELPRTSYIDEYGLETFIYGLPDWGHELFEKKWPEAKCAFPPINNDQYFDGSIYEAAYKADGNVQNIPECRHYSSVMDGLRYYFPVTPFPFFGYVLNRCFETFGYTIVNDYVLQSVLKSLIMLNANDIVDYTVTINQQGQGGGNHPRRFYNLKNHVPDIPLKKFLTQIKNKFNLHCFIDDKSQRVSILNLDDLLQKPVTNDLSAYCTSLSLKEISNYDNYNFSGTGDKTPILQEKTIEYEDVKDFIFNSEVCERDDIMLWDNKPKPGTYILNEIRKVAEADENGLSIYKYYQFTETFNQPSTTYMWTELGLADMGKTYNTGNKIFKFESDIMTTLRDSPIVKLYDISTHTWIDTFFNEPSYQKPGYSRMISGSKKDNALCFSFYLGPYPGVQNSIPYAKEIDTHLDSEAEHTLFYNHKTGLINKFWRRTLDVFMNRGKIFETTFIKLPANKLLNFDFTQKFHIHGGTFMVKNIKCKLTHRGIIYQPSEVIEV